MLSYVRGSTHTLTVRAATVSSGATLSGATVTADIVGRNNATIMQSVAVADQGGGVYTVAVPHNLAIRTGQTAYLRVVAVKNGVQATSRLAVLGRKDGN